MSNRAYLLVTIYLLLTAFHMVFFWDQRGPDVTPDEVSYLAQAKYFAGKSDSPETGQYMMTDDDLDWIELPDRTNWPYYHFGYSLLVSPVYLFTDDPQKAYQGVILINALMMASLFLFIYFWVREVSDLDFKKATSIALITAIYPSYNLHPHIGWPENALIPLFALSVLLYTHYLRNGSRYLLLLFVCIAGFLYTLHPRGIAGAIGAIICLLAFVFSNDKKRFESLIGIGVVVSIIYSTKLVSNALSLSMNTVQHSRTIVDKLSNVLDVDILLQLFGHFLYLALSTIGVFLMGMVFLFSRLRMPSVGGIGALFNGRDSGVYLYILLSSVLLFSAGVVFLSNPSGFENESFNPVIDKYMYGRYNEAFLSVYIAMGLIWASTKSTFINSQNLNRVFFVVVGICLVYSWFLNEILSDFRGMRSIHATALFPWFFLSMEFTGWAKLSGIFLGPLLWMWIFLKLSLQDVNKALMAIGLYFLALTASVLVYMAPSLKFGT